MTALPNYGELFENGANAAARDARHQGGALSASGGCGEIFRNFFFLPDRPVQRRGGRPDLLRPLRARATSPKRSTSAPSCARSRTRSSPRWAGPGTARRCRAPLIEQIYPRIRCRALFGREISLEARCGAYLMPFLDQQVVAEAMKLPLGLKNAGRFEAMLLERDRSGAGAAALRLRPRFRRAARACGTASANGRRGSARWRCRQRSYALRRRMGPVADEHGGLLDARLYGPGRRPRFSRSCAASSAPERIADSGMMRRIANLEYLAARLGSTAVRRP